MIATAFDLVQWWISICEIGTSKGRAVVSQNRCLFSSSTNVTRAWINITRCSNVFMEDITLSMLSFAIYMLFYSNVVRIRHICLEIWKGNGEMEQRFYSLCTYNWELHCLLPSHFLKLSVCSPVLSEQIERMGLIPQLSFSLLWAYGRGAYLPTSLVNPVIPLPPLQPHTPDLEAVCTTAAAGLTSLPDESSAWHSLWNLPDRLEN